MKTASTLLLAAALVACGDPRAPILPPALTDAGPVVVLDDAGPPPPTDAGPVTPPPPPPPPAPSFEAFVEDPGLEQVRAIWSGAGAVWFVTANEQGSFTSGRGQILRWTAGTDLDAWNLGDRMLDVHGHADGVWAVGENGAWAIYDGADGFDIARPIAGDLYTTWGDAEARYAGGLTWSRLEMRQGPGFTNTSSLSIDDADGDDIHCVAGTAEGLWACDEEACYGWARATDTWTRLMESDGGDCDIAPFAGRGALIAGARSVTAVDFTRVLLDGGFGPISLPIPDAISRGDIRIRGVWAEGSDAWMVGTDGYVAVNETFLTSPLGGQWRRVTVPTTADLHAIHGDANALWIGGEGIILRRGR